MTEQKQSLADFVFENKDKMPDNVYKILMEQYAKQEQQKGFVEVVYLYPKIVEYRDLEHRIEYKKRVAIVKKYDERFYGEDRNIKIGLVAYGRVCQDAYDTNSKENDISLCYEGNMRLVKSENCENGDERVCGDNVDTYNLICEEVFVVSVKDL